MKRKKTAFTLVELLTVLAVMSLLIGILIPSLKMAQDAAKTAKQKVHLVSIEQALLAFRNDYGDYPPSDAKMPDYGGAQKLAEALLGPDLLGFHPRSGWRSDGKDEFGAIQVYDGTDMNILQRKPRYLELETANAFRLGCSGPAVRDGLFDAGGTGLLAPATYVLCDIFNKFDVTVGGRIYKAGTPILYYKANPFGIGLDPMNAQNSNYSYWDNAELVHLGINSWAEENFYNFITDPRATAARPVGSRPWPYKPDSYILISAGIDGIYGTRDDITNFGNK